MSLLWTRIAHHSSCYFVVLQETPNEGEEYRSWHLLESDRLTCNENLTPNLGRLVQVRKVSSL